MSLSSDRSQLARLNGEIAALRGKEADEIKKMAEATRRMNSALDSARRTSSAATAKMHMSTAERESRSLQAAQKNQGRFSSQAATKTLEANRLQQRIARDEEGERKRAQSASERKQRDDTARQRRVEAAAEANSQAMQKRIEDLEAQVSQFVEAEASTATSFQPIAPAGQSEAYDVFISHAWEDKDDFVRELAKKAREAGLRVWYDEENLKWGDSLRQSIDDGLRGSYFGIAVLSPNFFAKQWTAYELDALVERTLSGTGRLLPIWHRVTKDDVAREIPSLANRLALNTALLSTDDIVRELLNLRDIYRAKSSPR